MPAFVKAGFEAFLECGIVAHGFLRLRFYRAVIARAAIEVTVELP